MSNEEYFGDEFCLPVGFIFEPSDTDLLSILEAKIMEQTSSFRFVPECNRLYDEEPWRIFGEPEKKKNYFYVFTALKTTSKKSKSKSKFSRRVGGRGGTWRGNNIKDVKNDAGVVVGMVRNFTFLPTEKGTAAAGRWIMYEFSIPKVPSYLSDSFLS